MYATAHWEQSAQIHIQNLTSVLFDAYDTHYVSAMHVRRYNYTYDVNDDTTAWTLMSAIFFTATLLTTIGL
jgi:hypothetical protein